VIELLLGMDFQLCGDVHILGAAEYLGLDNVGNDGLIFAGKVFVQQFRQTITGDFVFIWCGFELSHSIPP
jgi:hypothetical protein